MHENGRAVDALLAPVEDDNTFQPQLLQADPVPSFVDSMFL